MKTIILFCSILAINQGVAIDNRIVGGDTATPGQFPYIVSLRQISRNSHFCGGTIIGRRTILTAAHCKVNDIHDTIVVVGTNKLNDDNAKRYDIQEFIIHENYDEITFINDIAIIIVSEDITFSDLVKAAPLTSREILNDERVITSGWGWTSYPGNAPNDLQWMQTKVLSVAQCIRLTGNRYQRGRICTLEQKGIGACSGDSGGPLINDLNEIVGVTSAVYKCARGMPDFFTDVYYFKPWIIVHSTL